MRTVDDRDLLEAYIRDGSEAAVGELVQRHLAWVYSEEAAKKRVSRSILIVPQDPAREKRR